MGYTDPNSHTMSLTKLLKCPLKFFAKDVITFLVIHRYDLGVTDNKLRYLAVRPNSSIYVLRQKIWYMLDLPDYCEEVIVLKTDDDIELPLTELRKGNDPQHPHILEVWLPGKQMYSTTSFMNGGNMLTLCGENTLTDGNIPTSNVSEEKLQCNPKSSNLSCGERPILYHKNEINNRLQDNKKYPHNLLEKKIHCQKSELMTKVSSTSLFFKLQTRKSKDNVANILLKIQTDLTTLSSKLSNLENRIQT